MSRKKGTPKTGGRDKGTPNKITTDLKTWINDLLNNNREQFETDLKSLEPHQRVAIFEKMLSYVVSKQQQPTAEVEPQHRVIGVSIDDIINVYQKNEISN